jgi:hypothetical protein
MGYPCCPNCGRNLPIDVFFREVGARRIPSFGFDGSSRLSKDPLTGEEVPSEFSITCAGCGAKSAVDTWPGDKIQLAILAGSGLLLVVLVLVVLARGVPGWLVSVGVVVYLGAVGTVLKIAAVLTARMMRVTLISTPGAERDNETSAERRALADRDMDVEIARLGPDFLRVPEPTPLEPELADVAARIDAAYVAAPPSTSERPEYELAEEQELERAKVVCVACGEMNQRDFEKCWNCEGALPV